jgi:hypothetical protein
MYLTKHLGTDITTRLVNHQARRVASSLTNQFANENQPGSQVSTDSPNIYPSRLADTCGQDICGQPFAGSHLRTAN